MTTNVGPIQDDELYLMEQELATTPDYDPTVIEAPSNTDQQGNVDPAYRPPLYNTAPPAPPQPKQISAKDARRLMWAGILSDLGQAFFSYAGASSPAGKTGLNALMSAYRTNVNVQNQQYANQLNYWKANQPNFKTVGDANLGYHQIDQFGNSQEIIPGMTSQGLMSGTSLFSQITNNIARQLPKEKRTPFMNAMGAQQLGRPITITQADGSTQTIPGVDIGQVLESIGVGANSVDYGEYGRDTNNLQITGPGGPTDTGIIGIPQPGAGRTGEKVLKSPSEAERISHGFYDRMVLAESDLSGVPVEVLTDPANKGIYDYSPGFLGNMMVPPEYLSAVQAQENWVTANLRKESGAAIPPEEILQERRKYFPMPGDGPDQIAQKAQSRAVAAASMRRNSGKSFNQATDADRVYFSPVLAAQPGQTGLVTGEDIIFTAEQHDISEEEVMAQLGIQ